MKFSVLALVLSVGITSCASKKPSIQVVSPEYQKSDLKMARAISPSELNEDLDQLVAAIKGGYAGWDQLSASLTTTTFPAITDLKKSEVSSPLQVCRELGKIFSDLPDNHLAVKNFDGAIRCEGAKRFGKVGKNIGSRLKKTWSFRRVQGLPVLAINKLPPGNSPSWKGFLRKTRSIFENERALILDIRGVKGGDDQKTSEMARILFGVSNKEIDLSPNGRTVQRQAPVAVSLFLNTLGHAIVKLKSQNRGYDRILSYYTSYLELKDRADNGQLPDIEVTEKRTKRFSLESVFKGPIRILVDAECASGCESILEFFEKHPFVKSVGENSAGSVHFGQVGLVWLKNSNLFVELPTRSFEFSDKRFVEKTGYLPKIKVSGENALDVAIADIKKSLVN